MLHKRTVVFIVLRMHFTLAGRVFRGHNGELKVERNELKRQNAAGKLVALYAYYSRFCGELSAKVADFVRLNREGAWVARNAWPDVMLEPNCNRMAGKVEEEGRWLKLFRPGELPAEVVAKGEEYMAAEEKLVGSIEELVAGPDLLLTRSADRALWNYMITPVEEFDWRLHQAKVNGLVEAKIACYRNNALAICRKLSGDGTGMREARKERKMIGKLRDMTRDMKVLAQGEEENFWHKWRGKRARIRQVKAVWNCIQSGETAEMELMEICRMVYEKGHMAAEVGSGGYPNARALYQICHQHESELVRGTK